ncbi:unnamed protein product [Cuscuta campestris]|uniref:Patatin n=1 Tax=Cuscuta campestris TaxID=132261 RepID=A0A484LH04_9ASTE|nr:unnamed protein product [Cuscuta campestris]
MMMKKSNTTTIILCIDGGGGIRAIIPALILSYLESQLQELDGEEARIAEYMDVIGGTGTGGLITAMLTAPNNNNQRLHRRRRPLFAAKDIPPFFLHHFPLFFPHIKGPFGEVINQMKASTGPKYDGKYISKLVKDLFGGTRLHQTLTNVVIPTFDIKTLQPLIFNSFETIKDTTLDAKLSDICMGTTATPTLLPPHYFNNKDYKGTQREFNLVDGSLVANNPTLVAINEVAKQVLKGHPAFDHQAKPLEPSGRQYIVISIGAGSCKKEHKYNARKARKWGLFDWLFNGNSIPLMEAFHQASTDMVDVQTSVLLSALHSDDNYLRIQDETLCGALSAVDMATKENMERLVRVGENLLRKPVCKLDRVTGEYKPVHNGGTNMEALKKFAKMLSDERKLRQSQMALPLSDYIHS